MKKIAFACLLVVSCSHCIAALEVCGAIENGEVWSIENSPVRVSCDLNIAGLTINPGVEVHMTGDFEIVVSGVIRSLGTRESPIVFKPTENNTTGWGGFLFEDVATGSEFRWSQIKGATSSGVHLVRSNPSFDHVTFENNSGTYGGAIRAELLDHDLQIKNSFFFDNLASIAGGAIYAIGPTDPADVALKVTGSIFLQNHAGTTNSRNNTSGGAIFINGNSQIVRSTFSENEAQAYTIFVRGGRYSRGGAIYTAGGRNEISATTFIRNACRMGAHFQTPDASHAFGGALYLASGELVLKNSLLAKNLLASRRKSDHRGSGVYIAGGVGTIINSTLAYNSTHAVYRDGGQVDILNSILFFNNNSGAQIAGSVLASYSDIQNSFVGESNINVNPVFNELFGIVPPSPVIDMGHPNSDYNDLTPPGQGSVRNDMGYTGGPSADHWNKPVCYLDGDGDGYGKPGNFTHMESCSFNYVSNNTDCDDTDFQIFPGSSESCPATTGTKVCGLITDGTVWSIENSPVHISCNLNIAGLTINPGVEVHMTGDYEIVVSGMIRSLGTRESPIVFKPTENNTTGWGGFFFEDVATKSEFYWSQIKGATSSGVHLVRSNPSFDHVTFENNSGKYGGAIRAELLNHDLRINDSLFFNNVANISGGAIYTIGPTGPTDVALKVTASIFLQNYAGTTNSRNNTSGGAIFINGNSQIVRSTFSENEAQAYTIFVRGGRYTRGGAIYTAGGKNEINATTLLRNACRMGAHFQTPDASHAFGGTLYQASGELILSNSLLAENLLTSRRNSDHRGSGVYVAGGIVTIINSTLAYNSTHAVYRDDGQVDILNSILFFNNNSGDQIAGSILASYSDIQNSFIGEGNINVNPVFNQLFGIVPPSPVIDMGHPNPDYNDLILPGQGSARNDMGYTGGPSAVFSANAGPDQKINEGSTVTLDGTNSINLDNISATYSWMQITGPSINLSNSTNGKPTFIAPEVALTTQLTFKLVVSNSVSSSIPDTVTVTILDVTKAPTADAGQDQIVIERSTVTLDGTNSRDPDGDLLSYTWTQINDSSVAISANKPQPTFVAPDVSKATNLRFGLVVNDGTLNSTVDFVNVSVVLISTDSDNDGLTDLKEITQFGTDPYLADTDRDGVNDGNEIANGTEPNVNESAILSIVNYLLEED